MLVISDTMMHMCNVFVMECFLIWRGWYISICTYCQVSKRRTWVDNEIVDHSDAVGASPVSAAPSTSSFSKEHLASIYCAKTTASQVKKHLSFGIWCTLYQRFYGIWDRGYQRSGPWFNIKTSSYQYRKSHCGDKTILRPSYLHNGISYTGKITSLYWVSPLLVPLAHPITWSMTDLILESMATSPEDAGVLSWMCSSMEPVS